MKEGFINHAERVMFGTKIKHPEIDKLDLRNVHTTPLPKNEPLTADRSLTRRHKP